MSRTIRIDRDVHAYLQQHAGPLGTPNTVIRRLIGLPSGWGPIRQTRPAAAVLDALRDNPGATTTEIAGAAQIPQQTAYSVPKRLHDAHVVTRQRDRTDGGRATWRWRLNEGY